MSATISTAATGATYTYGVPSTLTNGYPVTASATPSPRSYLPYNPATVYPSSGLTGYPSTYLGGTVTGAYPTAAPASIYPSVVSGASFTQGMLAPSIVSSVTRPVVAGATAPVAATLPATTAGQLVPYQAGTYPASVTSSLIRQPYWPATVPATQFPLYQPVTPRVGKARLFPSLGACTKALLVGINYREQGEGQELYGCINDVRCLAHFLEDQGWERQNIVVMDEDQPAALVPTRNNILRMMDWLMEDCQAGDSLFFAFSGHGRQLADTSGDEEDLLDEALVALDDQPIVDDDLFKMLVQRLPPDAVLTAVTDCCHAGTILDLPYQMRAGYRAKVPAEGVPPLNTGTVICFSGCLDEEESGDVDAAAGYSGGACTNALLTALSNLSTNCTFGELLSEMTAAMKERGMTQAPVISASHLIRPTDSFGLTPQDDTRPVPHLRNPDSLNPYIDYIELDQYALAHAPLELGGRTRAGKKGGFFGEMGKIGGFFTRLSRLPGGGGRRPRPYGAKYGGGGRPTGAGRPSRFGNKFSGWQRPARPQGQPAVSPFRKAGRRFH